MSFADELQRHRQQTLRRANDVFIGVAFGARNSIVNGSEVTGAPGQPVDTGFLKASWQLSFANNVAMIATSCAYAGVIEYASKAAFKKSGVTAKTAPGRVRATRRFGVLGGQIGPALRGSSRKHIKSTVGGHHSVALTVAGGQRLVDVAVLNVNSAAVAGAAAGPSGLIQ